MTEQLPVSPFNAYARMRHAVEARFSLCLFLFCALGLVVPGLDRLPAETVIVALAGVIFLACFRMRLEELKRVRWGQFVVFYLVRYGLLPAIVYALAVKLSPLLALGLFLLAGAPPATSSPALAYLFGGNVSLSFAVAVAGNCLAPLLLPVSVALVVGAAVPLDTRGIFVTLIGAIGVPILAYLPLRRSDAVVRWVGREGSFLSILLIGITFSLAVAKRKALLLHAPIEVGVALGLGTLAIGGFYVVGWGLISWLGRAETKDRVTYALASGAGNISLVISVALLYFPPEVSLFLVVAEIPWVLALGPFEAFLRRRLVAGA